MADEVGICNSALVKIGASTIVSLTEINNKNARLCNEQYEKKRDELLRLHPWNFAIKRQKLAQVATDPNFGFQNAYQLPSDWIRTVEVFDTETGRGVSEYSLEGQKILSDWPDLWLLYVSRITDVNEMTPDFREALAWFIGRDLAIPIAQSNSIFQLAGVEFRRALARAKSTDGIEDFPERFPETSWTVIRRGGLWRTERRW